MWQWTYIILCLLVTTSYTSASDKGEWLQVNLTQGPILAQKDSNGYLYVFYNVPYATAPTGKHKFKNPLPPPTWTEPFHAIDNGTIIVCPQFTTPGLIPGLKMQENCLLANIYVPDTEEKNLSVLIRIHGGYFQTGYGDIAKPKIFMKPKDVIVVTFTYRLGISGFLCLGTEDVPGNAGMKDQVALLRWVKKNIGAFGGNPNDVTISGFSSGSTSVDLLMIAKSTEGLFHKVILESGSSLAIFSMQQDPIQNAKDHARALNFTKTHDTNALEEFYKSLSYDVLTADNFLDRTDSSFLFSPCLEPKGTNDAFITESPLHILKSGEYRKVPLLLGFTSMEGLFRIDLFDKWKVMMNENFSDFLPADLSFHSEDEKSKIAQRVKQYYFNERPISNDNILRYLDYFTHILIAYSSLKAVKLHVAAGHNEVYLYQYSFDNDSPVVPHTHVHGADHCAQTMALLDGKNITYQIEDDEMSPEYKNMKKVVREIWHNFVKTGKPVAKGSSLPAWPAVNLSGSPYMSLDQHLETRGMLLKDMFQFWNYIYENYYLEPVPPQKKDT